MSAAPRMNLIERAFQGVLVCRGYRRTWAFPREVAALLQRETDGQSVLHLFGGQAAWGVRVDADRSTKPQVVGNAFFPPFRCESFDVVICDPPYAMTDSNGAWVNCVGVAGCLARRTVWWFSTDQMGWGFHGLRCRRWWVVLVSARAPLRYLVDLERTRHPSACWPSPRKGEKQFAPAIKRYDWRSRIAQADLPFGVVS